MTPRPSVHLGMTGGEVRYESGLVEALVNDGERGESCRERGAGERRSGKHRTDNLTGISDRLSHFDTANRPIQNRLERSSPGR